MHIARPRSAILIVLPLLAAACALSLDASEYTNGGRPSPSPSADAQPTLVGADTKDAAIDLDAPGASDTSADARIEACTSPGAPCADGTVLVGLAPSGGRLYTTRCDLGQTWSGAACTGTRALLPFNDGNDTGGVFVGAVSGDDGASNTAKLIAADSDALRDGVQSHRAAAACAALNEGGHDDWYLPAADELAALYERREAVGNFLSGPKFYKSSTETHGPDEPYNALRQQFSDGYVYSDGDSKPVDENLRCVRRGL